MILFQALVSAALQRLPLVVAELAAADVELVAGLCARAPSRLAFDRDPLVFLPA